MRVAPRIELTASERRELEHVARSNTVSVRLARRAHIVLLAAEGKENDEIGQMLGVGRIQVGRWRGRLAQGGRVRSEGRARARRSNASDPVEGAPVKWMRTGSFN